VPALNRTETAMTIPTPMPVPPASGQTAHCSAPELTIYRVAELKGQWLDAYRGGCRLFDLGDVVEIDSAGLQLLAALRRLGQEQDDPVELLNTPPCVEALAVEMNVAWLRSAVAA
jgi:ABC-type transporter Mla MlaB component